MRTIPIGARSICRTTGRWKARSTRRRISRKAIGGAAYFQVLLQAFGELLGGDGRGVLAFGLGLDGGR